ncbi:MAG: tRNA-dihydrouridine synthase family protein [Nanoarchaeota archaeon]|nr:tRNA-dihydrouridine synthase family protein [Nanoarchaeota archaeon]MCG2718051.1 tRNA-dihydrouridine synthase family protein [Nanoarchaeota archaeon]
MKIGNVKIVGKVILASMLEITNLPYRILCKKYGAALGVTEMVNANAVCRNNKAALKLAATCEEERPVAIQLFGAKVEMMKNAASLLHNKADIIDLNFGCPARDVLRQGAGAALLKRPARIKEIVQSITNQGITVTAKVRKAERMEEVLKAIEEGGASAVTVHGRTVPQSHSGKADWTVIKKAKEMLSIPVIGNGGVRDEETAKRMIQETGCDLVMIGREAIGNPYIFSRINHFLKTNEKLPPLTKEKYLSLFLEYIDLAKKYDCESFEDFKRKAYAFMPGIKCSTTLWESIAREKNLEEIKNLLKSASVQ